MVPRGEVHHTKNLRFGMADAFEQTPNERDRPTHRFGTLVVTTIVNTESERIQRPLYDDRVAVIHRTRWFDDLIQKDLFEGFVDFDFFFSRLGTDGSPVVRLLPLCLIDCDLKRCQLGRECGDGVPKYIGIFETEGSAITLKGCISFKRDLRQKGLGCNTCLGLRGDKRPKSVYLVDGENDTTGHFGRSVELGSDLSTRYGRGGSRGVALTPIYCSRNTAGGLVNLARTTRLVNYASASVTRTEVRSRDRTTAVCFR
jgi:hypothetical protein